MAPVAIVSDTCHYLPRELVVARGIHEVSLYVHWSGDTNPESEITDYDAYYERLRTAKDLPTTSQPSIGDFLAVYEPLLEAGHEIVSIHLAGGMSGTVRSAEQAREQLGSRAERVHVIDSATACGGEGLILLAAAAAAEAGGDGAAVADRARRAREGLKMWFAIDTLEYLRRGGRIGGRVPDHADRARAHVRPRVRAPGRSTSIACRRRRRRVDGPAHPGARSGTGARQARHRDLRPRTACHLPDRPRDRDSCGTGFARHGRDSRLFV